MDNSNKTTVINPELAKKPIMGDQPLDLIHTRRNLLIISFIVIFGYIADINISRNTLNNYIEGEKLTLTHINLAALMVLVYLWISFIWKFWDFYKSQIILTTRTISLEKDLGMGLEEGPHPNLETSDYSSIYNWWLAEEYNLKHKSKAIEELIENLVKNKSDAPDEDSRQIEKLNNILVKLRAHYFPQNDLIKISMAHFERSFRRFLYSQKMRVTILEGWLPFMFGLISISILLRSVFLTLYCN